MQAEADKVQLSQHHAAASRLKQDLNRALRRVANQHKILSLSNPPDELSLARLQRLSLQATEFEHQYVEKTKAVEAARTHLAACHESILQRLSRLS